MQVVEPNKGCNDVTSFVETYPNSPSVRKAFGHLSVYISQITSSPVSPSMARRWLLSCLSSTNTTMDKPFRFHLSFRVDCLLYVQKPLFKRKTCHQASDSTNWQKRHTRDSRVLSSLFIKSSKCCSRCCWLWPSVWKRKFQKELKQLF